MSRQFNPTFPQLLAESFSRIQIRPLQVTQEHIVEALRSANLMLIEFQNHGVNQFQLTEQVITLEAEEPTYELIEGAIDVWSVVHRRDGLDTPVWPMARTDYQRIPDKDNPGRPFNYFVERGKTGISRRTITLWPVPDRDDDELVLWVWARGEDQEFNANAPMAFEWFDAYAANMAKRLAEKFAPKLYAQKEALAEKAFDLAFGSDRERTPFRVRFRGYTRGRKF